jgi:site-specific DNA recombinase
MSKHARTSTIKDAASQASRRKRAVLYLRVSTSGQVNNDYDPEGISLPAQRDACVRKAAELGAEVADEYIEPGRTATEIEKRPVFQEMLARIKAEKDVDYIIVHHFNRIFRNSIDAAITKKELKKLDVRIVSTIVDLGDTLESQMVESILHAVDEYQVKRSNADVKYKMGAKARKGGTITAAPLGYLNVRENFEGREVRTVIVDKERAPLLVQGLELFATGQYAAVQVLEKINKAGLRTRGTRRTPAQPLSLNQFYNILSSRYYVGKIEHDGEEYDGRHPALIDEALYDRIQRVLALHGGGGTRQRKHHHYLKGTLWCGACGKRLIIMPGRGNGGTYFYFFCKGRQEHICTQPYISVTKIEDAVLRHYATVRLSGEFITRVRQHLQDTLLSELGSLDTLKKRLNARLLELDTSETSYIRLVGKPGWPESKIQAELIKISEERADIQDQLASTTTNLETGREFYLTAMELLSNPQEFYRRARTSLRKAMNKVIFDKLFVEDGEVTRHQLSEAAKPLIEAQEHARTYYRRSGSAKPAQGADGATYETSPFLTEEAGWNNYSDADLLAATLSGHGSSRALVVEVPGIEPGSIAALPGLLRAQLAVPFSAPLITQASQCDGPSRD